MADAFPILNPSVLTGVLESSKRGVVDNETVDLSSTQQRQVILDETLNMLNGMRFYRERGSLDRNQLMAGTSPLMGVLFPDEEERKNFRELMPDEQENILLEKLTGLSRASVRDYTEAAAKGLVEGAGGATSALQAARLGFAAAPLTIPAMGQYGLLSKPLAGLISGLGGALGFNYVAQPLLEEFLPINPNLLPGETDRLEGVQTGFSIVGGTPVALPQVLGRLAYKEIAEGPAMVIRNIRAANQNMEAFPIGLTPIPVSRAGRLAGALDDALPALARFGRDNPGKMVAADAIYATLAGTAVSQLELKDNPVARLFVEGGLSLAPTYSVVNFANKAVKNLPGAFRMAGKFSPFRFRNAASRQGIREDISKVGSAVKNTFKPDLLQNKSKILESREGRKAVQHILDVFYDMGENPADVARRLSEGGDFLNDVDRQAIKRILQDDGFDENPLETLPSGVRARSPALTALQTFYELSSRKQPGRPFDKNFDDAARFQTALIRIFSTSGDREALSLANDMRRAQLEQGLTKRLVDVSAKALDAARRVGTKYSKGVKDPDLKKQIDLSEALYSALEYQTRFAKEISRRLYAEAAIDVDPITRFKNAEGEDIEVPLFIQRWDKFISEQNDETLDRLRNDSFFKEAEKTIELFKSQLGMAGARPVSPQELKLESLKAGELSESEGLKFFNRIISDEVDFSGNTAKQTKAREAFDEAFEKSVQGAVDSYENMQARLRAGRDKRIEELKAGFPNPGTFNDITDEIRFVKKALEGLGSTRSQRGRDYKKLLELRIAELTKEPEAALGDFYDFDDLVKNLDQPKIELNAAGEPVATAENIAAIQKLIDNQMPAQGSSKVIRDATKLLRAQKDALTAQLNRNTGASNVPDGIDPKALTNLLSSMTTWTANTRFKNDQAYHIASQLKKAIPEDLNNTVGDESIRFNEARNFYKAYMSAISRTVAGLPAARKGFDESLVDEEEYALDILRGNDIQSLGRVKDILAGGAFLRGRAEELIPDDAQMGNLTGRQFKDSVETKVTSTDGLVKEVYSRDVIQPLQDAADSFDALNPTPARLPDENESQFQLRLRQHEEKRRNTLNTALAKVKLRLDAEDGSIRSVLGDDYTDALKELDDATSLLVDSKNFIDELNLRVKNDVSLSEALNSQTPILSINKALNDRQGGDRGLALLVNSIRQHSKREGISPDDALKGLRSQLFEIAFNKAGGDGGFDPRKAYNFMFSSGGGFKTTEREGRSLAQVMSNLGIIEGADLQRYKKLLVDLDMFQNGLAKEGAAVNPENLSFMEDYFLRVGAARLGAMAMPGRPGMGTGMIEASAAIRAAKIFTEKIPLMRQHAVIEKIISDPALTAAALAKPRNPDDKLALNRYILKKMGNLFGNMFNFAGEAGKAKLGRTISSVPRVVGEEEVDFLLEDDDEVVIETDDDLAGGAGDDQLTQGPQMSPAPQFQLPSQQAGFLPQLTQAAQAGAPASRPTGQPNPQQRQGLAALFPNDPILGVGRGV